MPRFEPNRPIETQEPFITVDPGLQPGTYRFQLVVEDASGNRSLVDERIVTITPRRIQ